MDITNGRTGGKIPGLSYKLETVILISHCGLNRYLAEYLMRLILLFFSLLISLPCYSEPITWHPINLFLNISVDPEIESILKSCLRREFRKFPDVTISEADDEEVDYKFIVLGTEGAPYSLSLIAFQTTGRKFLKSLREKMEKDAPHADAALKDYVWSAVQAGRYAGADIKVFGLKQHEKMCLEVTSFFDNNVLEKERSFRKKLGDFSNFFNDQSKKK
jgi:hypothetical protein